jgi:thymidine kinase
MADKYANHGKIVIIAALDSTFERKPFGQILNLLPISEKITKLNAVCVGCGDDASFTKRTSEDKKVELIGGSEMYEPVCRKCFFIVSRNTTATKASM